MGAAIERQRDVQSQFVREVQKRLERYRRIVPPLEPPPFLEVQKRSYDWFLKEGLRELLRSFSPIEDYTGTLVLEFLDYTLEKPQPHPGCEQCEKGACHRHKYYSPDACKELERTYEASLRAKVRLIDKEVGEVKEWGDVYLGELPLMTERGTFIVNGTERVVVSQINRSSGVYFSSRLHELTGKELFMAQIVALDGNWVEFETDAEDVIRVRIGGSKLIPATLLLKAFSALPETRGNPQRTLQVDLSKDKIIGKRLAQIVIDEKTGERLADENTIITPEIAEKLRAVGITKVSILEEPLPCGTTADIVRLFGVPVSFDPSLESPDELRGFWLLEDLHDPRSRRVILRAPVCLDGDSLERVYRLLKEGIAPITLYRCDP